MNPRQLLVPAIIFAVGTLVGVGGTIVHGAPDRDTLAKREAFEVAMQRKLARIEELCADRPASAGLDPAVVASLLSAQLRGSLSGAAAAPHGVTDGPSKATKDVDALPDEPSAEVEGNGGSVLAANRLIESAVSVRRWTPDDRQRLRVLLQEMPVSERDQTLASLAHRLNTGELRPTDNEPPF